MPLVLAFFVAGNENRQLKDLSLADFGRLPERHGRLQVRNFSHRVQLNSSLVRCVHSRAIELNTRREIPRAPTYYSLYIIIIVTMTSFLDSHDT